MITLTRAPSPHAPSPTPSSAVAQKDRSDPSSAWQTEASLLRELAIREGELFRYARRGMIGAQMIDGQWHYDVERARDLWLPRRPKLNSSPQEPPTGSFGVLGDIRLGG